MPDDCCSISFDVSPKLTGGSQTLKRTKRVHRVLVLNFLTVTCTIPAPPTNPFPKPCIRPSGYVPIPAKLDQGGPYIDSYGKVCLISISIGLKVAHLENLKEVNVV